MRKEQVGATTVDVDLWAKVFEGHRRALDMPARAAHAPGAIPARFGRRACLPEHEIERVLLAGVIRIGASLRGERDHLLSTQPAQATVVGDAPHAEIDVAVALVGVALRLQPDDQRDDLWDRLAGPREDVGGQHIEGGHVLYIEGGLLVGETIPGGPELARPPDA